MRTLSDVTRRSVKDCQTREVLLKKRALYRMCRVGSALYRMCRVGSVRRTDTDAVASTC